MATTPNLVGSREACKRLGIARSTLTYWMLTDRIAPAQVIPGPSERASSYLFDPADIERLALERAS